MMRVFCDGHVHIHREFDLAHLFDVALRRAVDLKGPLMLLLTEAHGRDEFIRLWETRERSVAPGFRLRASDDAGALRVERENDVDGSAAYLVAGRQLVSQENLEILALVLNPEDAIREIADRTRPARELIPRVLEAGAAAVLPWGFGKWLGRRGRLVKELSADPDWNRNPLFFLGDISHRFAPWPTPAVFQGAVRVLPGTDILPLTGIESRLARYGFSVTGEFEPDRPAVSLLDILRKGGTVDGFGRRESLPVALWEQMLYRLHSPNATP